MSIGDGKLSALEMLFILLVSFPKLDLRVSKNGACSNSPFGDSYALGIAGTGGTISSSPCGVLSFLVLAVGNREVETLWEIRNALIEARQEL